MKLWNLYNASMIMAVRCNTIFSKAFLFKIMRGSYFYIDAYPQFNPYEAPYNIHMNGDSSINQLEIYLNGFPDISSVKLNNIARLLSKGIPCSYSLVRNKGIIFHFTDSLSYPEFCDVFDFDVDGEHKQIESDHPMFHYYQTEFEVALDFNLYEDYTYSVTNIKRNGIPLFTLSDFLAHNNTLVLEIKKKASGFSIQTGDNSFMYNKENTQQVMSIIGQLSLFGGIKAINDTVSNPYMKFYFRKLPDCSFVKLERFDNIGMTIEDLRKCLPMISRKFGLDPNINWANFISI